MKEIIFRELLYVYILLSIFHILSGIYNVAEDSFSYYHLCNILGLCLTAQTYLGASAIVERVEEISNNDTLEV